MGARHFRYGATRAHNRLTLENASHSIAVVKKDRKPTGILHCLSRFSSARLSMHERCADVVSLTRLTKWPEEVVGPYSDNAVYQDLRNANDLEWTTMRAFQIKLNGKRICLAGIGDDGVLSTTITYTPSRRRQNTRLYVGGLLLSQDEHVKWKSVSLKVGDEVKLKVVEAAAVDRPSVRYPRDRVKRRLRELAKKFGWKSQTIPKHK